MSEENNNIQKEEQLETIYEQGSIKAPVEQTEIIYYKPKFHRRVLANLIDILLFALVFISSFSLIRYCVSQTDIYQAKNEEITQIRLDSGIYIYDDDNNLTDIITVLNEDDNQNPGSKKNHASNAIETFLSYAKEVCEEEDYLMVQTVYDDFRLAEDMVYSNSDSIYNGYPLFILDDDGNIIENSVLLSNSVTNIYNYYYNNCYSPFIDDYLQGYLITIIPNYYDLTKYFSNMLIYVDILPAYLLSGILVYYIPTLCFRRGRCTLGKAAYRIGLVDSRVLSPKFGRTTARFAIFYFLELILSVFSFALPFIISFTMMLFTKNGRGFPDYMLGLTEVDMSRTKIYKSFDEADLDKFNTHKKPVDFTMRRFN